MPTISKTKLIFAFVSDYISLYHKAPTLRRIANEFQMRSTAGVHRHLVTMRRLGWIKRERFSRIIEITKPELKKAA